MSTQAIVSAVNNFRRICPTGDCLHDEIDAIQKPYSRFEAINPQQGNDRGRAKNESFERRSALMLSPMKAPIRLRKASFLNNWGGTTPALAGTS